MPPKFIMETSFYKGIHRFSSYISKNGGILRIKNYDFRMIFNIFFSKRSSNGYPQHMNSWKLSIFLKLIPFLSFQCLKPLPNHNYIGVKLNAVTINLDLLLYRVVPVMPTGECTGNH